MSAPVPGRVSVIIPAYKSRATVGAAIDSCLAQTWPDLEVLVVNDGSPDPGLGEVLRSYGERIRAIDQANGGVAAARNTGARSTTGEFVAWMDDDDLMLPDRVRLQVELMRANPDLALVSTEFCAFSSQGDIPGPYSGSYYSAVKRLGGMERIYPETRPMAGGGRALAGNVYDKLVSGNFVHPPTVMVRRAVFDAAGWFDTSLRYSSDWDEIIRIARTGPFGFIPVPLLRYRRAESQLSHAASGGRMPLETIRVLQKVRESDPDLYHRSRELFAERFGRAYVEAAEVIGAERGAEAIGLLLKSLRHKRMSRPWLHALAKAMTPGPLVRAWRRARHT